MRTRIIMLAAVACAALATACDDENEKLRDDYKIYINGKDKPDGNKSADQRRLTAHEVCLIDTVMLRRWRYTEGQEDLITSGEDIYSVEQGNLDTVNNRLVMVAGNIDTIKDNPWLEPEWTYYIQNGFYGDTVAYIPSAQRSSVIDLLTPLFEDGREKNIDKILDIFQTAFVFYPCTGEEFKELEAQGLN